MEFKDVVYGRRSVRSYSDRPVDEAVLCEIMDAALWAPSGVNLQPWYFVVIKSPEQMEKFKNFMSEVAERNRDHLERRFASRPDVARDSISFIRNMGNAPVAVLAFRNKTDYSWALQDEGVVQSIAAAMENLILSAYDHGVSSCWMTAPSEAHMAEELRDRYAPGHGNLVSMAVLGYAKDGISPVVPSRKLGRCVFL